MYHECPITKCPVFYYKISSTSSNVHLNVKMTVRLSSLMMVLGRRVLELVVDFALKQEDVWLGGMDQVVLPSK